MLTITSTIHHLTLCRFFEKLVLCRGLDFALPRSQPSNDKNDIKVYWKREKETSEKIRNILPENIANQLCPQGSPRLAHLYGLPKTHKQPLQMRPILSATGTYNFKLAKWLDQKLKPLIKNKYMIDDVAKFVEDIRRKQLSTADILV